MAVNLSAAFHTIRTVLPQMSSRNWGRIVNVSSAYGLIADADRVSYIASKFWIGWITKAVALETAGSAICNAVCPGIVMSPYIRKKVQQLATDQKISIEEAETRFTCPYMPAGRALRPEQIAEIVAFLCSDAAAEIRGAAWSADGGWTAR